MLTEDTPEAVAEALIVLLADPGLQKQPGERRGLVILVPRHGIRWPAKWLRSIKRRPELVC